MDTQHGKRAHKRVLTDELGPENEKKPSNWQSHLGTQISEILPKMFSRIFFKLAPYFSHLSDHISVSKISSEYWKHDI